MLKKVITGTGIAVMLIFTILIVMTFHGRDVRETELETSLSTSMEAAMKTLNDKHGYAPESNEEFAASFIEAFLCEIESENINVNIDITDIDYEKGLLKAEVSAQYKHPIGTTGNVSVEKTMIMEKYRIDEDPVYCEIQFLDADGSIIKTYKVEEGSQILTPDISGADFKNWENTEDGTTLEGGVLYTLEADEIYMAVYE